MKKILIAALVVLSTQVMSEEVFQCRGNGLKTLTIHEDRSVTLKSTFSEFDCEIGTTPFPGTELELRVLNCKSGNRTVTYYFTEYDAETVILSTGLVWSKDISCKKI